MSALVHIIIFLISTGIVWYFAGVLVDAVGRIAKRSCRSGFFTAFFVLGFLTSISEFSVAINAGIAGVPGVSVGNLIGASFVVLLFIVPLLAIAGQGIRFNKAIPREVFLITLTAIVLPTLLVMDGNVTRTEGFFALLSYGTVAFVLFKNRTPIRTCEPVAGTFLERTRSLLLEMARVVVGAVAIFAAAHFLVEQALYFANALSVPSSLIGLILLSIGTNIPEIVIAVRSLFKQRSDIAFGDYLGSAAMNTLIFGGLAIFVGGFSIEPTQFMATALLFVSGLTLLYLFARSKLAITRGEGAFLMLFYIAFLVFQVYTLARFAGS
jgi:cation:H+ antiporter